MASHSRLVCRLELLLAVLLAVTGLVLRCWRLDVETVEHFDEGVYSSVLWYDGAAGQPWPGRQYFAPGGLPLLIELSGLLTGQSRLAPLFPAVCFGVMTPLACWLLAREWFGRTTGFLALAISATSDFHILYSRMALTDVPVLFFQVLAVWQGSRAVFWGRWRAIVCAGLCTAAGWWLKYTGWLPLAILYSGVAVWWLAGGHQSHRFFAVLWRLFLVTVVTAVGFLPCWLQLQQVGGYSAVSAGHLSYVSGWAGWSANLQEQLAGQDRLDGFRGATGLGLGFALFGILRSLGASGSTWNAGDPVAVGQMAVGNWWRGVMGQCFRTLAAAVFLGVLSLRVGTPFILLTLAVGGLAGSWLWPTVMLQWRQSRVGQSVVGSDKALQLSAVPATAAAGGRAVYGGGSAAVDPALGFWLLTAWFLGLLLVTPLYYPYSRLYLPLCAAVWLASAAALGWWLESGLARLELGWQTPSAGRSPLRFVSNAASLGLLAAVVASSFYEVDENGTIWPLGSEQLLRTQLYRDRRSVESVAVTIADVCLASAGGMEVNPPRTPRGQLISPEQLQQTVPSVSIPRLTVEQREQVPAVLYAFGEPALLLHLHREGVVAGPVSHVSARSLQSRVPTFLILGPNAWRTPGFWDQWMLEEVNYEWLGDFEYNPGVVTMMDLYAEHFLSEHDDVWTQRFEVYRVRAVAGQATSGN